jgi:3-oxoacyl-[acyl-carrier protein] reductase
MMQGKNYLIVGGSKGIGLEVSKLLLDEGANVFVASRSNDFQNQVFGANYLHYDAREAEGFDATQLPETLHGLVYAPGTISLKPFHRIKKEDFLDDLQVNALGCVDVLQACMERLKKNNAASVVLFSTVAVGIGMPFHASIALAKGAVEGLTRTLAAEWAPVIRVNAIAPSLTNTPLAEKLLNTPEKIEASAQRHPLKKVGDAAQIAKMALHLLSDDAGFITGQVFKIDGGISAIKI